MALGNDCDTYDPCDILELSHFMVEIKPLAKATGGWCYCCDTRQDSNDRLLSMPPSIFIIL